MASNESIFELFKIIEIGMQHEPVPISITEIFLDFVFEYSIIFQQ